MTSTRSLFLRSVQLIAALVFLSAAVGKLMAIEEFRNVLHWYVPFVPRWNSISVVPTASIVFFETSIGFLLLFGAAYRATARAAIAFLILATVVIARALFAGDPPACGCSGFLSILGNAFETVPIAIARNIILVAGLTIVARQPPTAPAENVKSVTAT
ncbi:MAG: MauE/DoxX family redox-associated membrane protein [Phycisphaerales bacterium]